MNSPNLHRPPFLSKFGATGATAIEIVDFVDVLDSFYPIYGCYPNDRHHIQGGRLDDPVRIQNPHPKIRK